MRSNNDNAHLSLTVKDVARTFRREPCKKAFTGPRSVKATYPFQAFAHNVHAQSCKFLCFVCLDKQ